MLQKILKYLILALFMLNLPTVGLNTFGGAVGSIFSYSAFFLLAVYYVLFLLGPPNMWLLYIGLSYFLISGLQMYVTGDAGSWSIAVAKYLVLIVFGNEFYKKVTKKEMVVFLLIGATSIILNAFVTGTDHGRASGFYFNANPAGLVCLFGYTLCYSLNRKGFRQFSQIVFTLAGFVTFSRTFLLVWIIINLFSLKKDIKNIRIFVIGISAFVSLFVLGELLNLGGKRFEAFKSVFTNERSSQSLDDDSRTGTWAMYYDSLMDNPIFGGGYSKFKSDGLHSVGVHNTYLLIWGEAGIIPFMGFLIFILYMLHSAYGVFARDQSLFYMAVTIALYLMTLHTYFEYYVFLSITLFTYSQIISVKNQPDNRKGQKLPLTRLYSDEKQVGN